MHPSLYDPVLVARLTGSCHSMHGLELSFFVVHYILPINPTFHHVDSSDSILLSQYTASGCIQELIHA
jgi:hypothetical protein